MEVERERKVSVRDKRRKQKRRRRWKRLLLTLLALLLLAAAAFLVVWKVFTVEKVIVEGNEHYSGEQIQKFVLNDEYSWNSLYVTLKYRFFEVKEVPFVDSIEVSLEDSHTIKLNVTEKGIIGYIYISAIDRNAYFDTDGFVVETSKEIISGIPQIEGLSCDKVVLYEKLPIKDEKILKNLLDVTRALKKNEAVPDKIQFGDAKDISLDYGGIQVLLGGEDNLTQKILRLSHILPELSGKKGVLHIENWTENTTNIIFDEVK